MSPPTVEIMAGSLLNANPAEKTYSTGILLCLMFTLILSRTDAVVEIISIKGLEHTRESCVTVNLCNSKHDEHTR
ncbi:hypothetical protein BZA70DRAFT_270528 [Myxozyma melibiosi]|uniref:Uncharacterized protein n=1 Tax=Myxozyma melibiosi TaxID=54550 RepID=A0ABR1FBJ2_9ASCO